MQASAFPPEVAEMIAKEGCVNALLQASAFPLWLGWEKGCYEKCVNALLQASAFPRDGYDLLRSKSNLLC